MFRCKTGIVAKDTAGKVLMCAKDEDCNRVEGKELADASKWDNECVDAPEYNMKFCCPVSKCKDQFTYMRGEYDCNGVLDCLKEEVDKTTKADARARCEDYYEKNKQKGKKCCPLGNSID
ncbi:hypothetical protein V3C99_018264 [Haemonchus contortus]